MTVIMIDLFLTELIVLISDRADCFVERYEYIVNYFPQLKMRYYSHLSDILLFYYNNAVSFELKKKLQEYIKTYPYIKLGIFRRFLKREKENKKLSKIDKINKELLLFD